MPRDPRYVEAIRLLDRGDYFEAHESLEDLWRETSGPDREFYQGVIQVSVAFHHLVSGNLGGARRVRDTARRRLAPFRPRRLGLEIDPLLAALDAAIESVERNGAVDPALLPSVSLDP